MASAVEGGLDQAALAEVGCAFVGQQTFAEEGLGALENAALHERRVLRDKGFLHQRGRVQEVHVLVAGAEVAEVAVVLGAAGEEAERIGTESAEAAAQGADARTGRAHQAGHEAIAGGCCVSGT
jgi:hypothetical protein